MHSRHVDVIAAARLTIPCGPLCLPCRRRAGKRKDRSENAYPITLFVNRTSRTYLEPRSLSSKPSSRDRPATRRKQKKNHSRRRKRELAVNDVRRFLVSVQMILSFDAGSHDSRLVNRSKHPNQERNQDKEEEGTSLKTVGTEPNLL